MEAYAESIASNYYLQAVAILVALVTFVWGIIWGGKYIFWFLNDVVRIGIRRAIRIRHLRMMRRANEDAQDPILFVSGIFLSLAPLLAIITLILLLSSMSSDPRDAVEVDLQTFGFSLSESAYLVIIWISKLLWFWLSILFFSMWGLR